jgi:hypothetical protein
METIPFKAFVGGYISPDPGILTMLDNGLTFFVGTGVVLLALVALEKMGVTINDSTVRWVGLGGVLIAFLFFVLRNPVLRRLAIGF